MPDAQDMDLVREFARHNSEAAFTELVRRHIALVYSVARRCTGNDSDAQDVTQAVFIILARKAAGLRERTLLPGWLYETTRFTAARLLRTNVRRQQREQEAYMQSTLNESDTADVWEKLSPHLEDAMSKLAERDRALLVLRFYQNKSGPEAAALLGIREGAAHMRVTRAIEKLRKFFTKRGVTISGEAIAETISTHSVQAAPVALAKTISAVAITKGAAAGGSTLALVKGALKLMAWTKAKTAVVLGVGLLLAVGTTTVTVKEFQEHKTYPWEVPQADFSVFYKMQPAIKIVPTKFAKDGGWCCDSGRGAMGIAQPLQTVIQAAYQTDKLRTVVADDLPAGRYDFFAKLVPPQEPHKNMPADTNWAGALQKEISRRFGVVGRMESRETDVMILKPSSKGARAFKVSHQMPNGLAGKPTPGNYSFFMQPVSSLTSLLENRFQIPTLDRTGLTEKYDYSLKWDEPDFRQPNLEGLKQALNDQLGLELVPSREPIEMLVVEKAK